MKCFASSAVVDPQFPGCGVTLHCARVDEHSTHRASFRGKLHEWEDPPEPSPWLRAVASFAVDTGIQAG